MKKPSDERSCAQSLAPIPTTRQPRSILCRIIWEASTKASGNYEFLEWEIAELELA
jgi:hypothetical protein